MRISSWADRLERSALLLFLLVLVACRPGSGEPQPLTAIPSSTAQATGSSTALPATPTAVRPTATARGRSNPAFTLFFASDRAGPGAIYRLDGDGSPRLVTTDSNGVWDPAVRPGSEHLAFTTYAANNGDIALLDWREGTPVPLVTDAADDYDPSWSPDGSRLAFVSERDGGQDLYLVRPEAPGEEQRLTAGTGLQRHRSPAWTPDGRALIFAGLDENGIEGLYRLDLDGFDLEPLTAWPLKATQPAVSGEGEIAFIGWRDLPTRTLSVLPPEGGAPRTLLTTTDWIGHPAWSPDGAWILFTTWKDPAAGHDLYAIPAVGGAPVRLTGSSAWDDRAAPVPPQNPPLPEAGPLSPPREPSESPAESTRSSPDRRDFALGFNLANLSNSYLVHDLGGTWVKGFADWARTEPKPGSYYWLDVDNTVREAEAAGLKLFLRIHNAPAWSHSESEAPNTPPDDPAEFARFAATVAQRYRGKVAAYELWNEPNLAFEWGNQPPDPAGYVALLKAAYPAIKAVDPSATVVVGALSSTAGGSETAMGDLDYLEAMYASGAARGVTHDAIATHPYGFGRAPDAPADFGLGLRHLEAQREVMVAAGDQASPLWITETGWPVKMPGWDLGEHAPWALDFAIQADYYAALPETVAREWPFVAALFPFNLDFSTVAWYPAGEQMRAYALLNPDGSPRPAYTALRAALRGR